MREIEIRIQHLEQRLLPGDPVGVLMPTGWGTWRLSFGKKERYFNTEAEGKAFFDAYTRGKKTRFDPVLCILDV